MATWAGGAQMATPTPTILDPSDPALGNSYEDGVERARRVTLKKKKPTGVGDVPAPPAGGALAANPEEVNLLADPITGLVDPEKLATYRRVYGGAAPVASLSGGVYDNPKRTILGG